MPKSEGNPKSEIRKERHAVAQFNLPIAILLGGLLLPHPIQAQPAPGGAFITRSQSGQFIIHASQPTTHFAPAFNARANTNFVRLDAARLTVAAERIKQVLWRDLAANAPWRGKIHLFLHPANGSDETITLTSEQFRDGWQYGVYLPDLVERERFMRSIVQALLLEMANRNTGPRGAEIPLWLTEGLTQQLLADQEAGLIPPQTQPGQSGGGFDRLNVAHTSVDLRTNYTLAQAHHDLRNDQTLTFNQLSWPTEDALSGEMGAAYRGSSHLLVAELSHLKNGRPSLRAMVEALPAHLNWQIAFLKAFQDSFTDTLAVEKWWALRLARFTDRDLAQTWPLPESLRRLDQALRSPIQVRTRPNELPLRSEASLQTIIREWEKNRQTETLKSKIGELELLRLRVSRELAGLVEDYRQTLLAYLQNQSATPAVYAHGERSAQTKAGLQTLNQLDALDARRAALERSLEPVATAQARPETDPDP